MIKSRTVFTSREISPFALVIDVCRIFIVTLAVLRHIWVVDVIVVFILLLCAQVLAKKMTVLYKLASGQLSKQSHYDFGLRALKAVLVMAGELKRGSPELNEVSQRCNSQHQTANSPFSLPHITYSRDGENFLINLATEFMLGDHILYSRNFSAGEGVGITKRYLTLITVGT